MSLEAPSQQRSKPFALSMAALMLMFTGVSHAYDMWLKILIGPRHDCVHERLTLAAQACVGKETCAPNNRRCDDPDWGGIRDGVRWNDDPLRLLNDGRTYIHSGAYFTHGARLSVRDPEKIDASRNTHYRSHFGDLQFLHSMASRAAELPEETQRRVLLWSEFVYRVAIGDIDTETPLKDVPIDGIPQLFPGKQWTVRALLALRCKSGRDCIWYADVPAERVRLTALGSLLHMVQDSFSASHAKRMVTAGCFGAIKEYAYYPAQVSKEHAVSDRAQEWMKKPISRECLNPVTASARVLELAGYGGTKAPVPWSEAEGYLRDTVFRIER